MLFCLKSNIFDCLLKTTVKGKGANSITTASIKYQSSDKEIEVLSKQS